MHIIKSSTKEGTNCVVVSYSEEEQRRDGVKAFEAMFWSPEEPEELCSFGSHGAQFDSMKEACDFLDAFDWNFDNYEPSEVMAALTMIKNDLRET